jgi:hypothetical protein
MDPGRDCFAGPFYWWSPPPDAFTTMLGVARGESHFYSTGLTEAPDLWFNPVSPAKTSPRWASRFPIHSGLSAPRRGRPDHHVAPS